MELDTGATPLFKKPRPVPSTLRDTLSQELDHLESDVFKHLSVVYSVIPVTLPFNKLTTTTKCADPTLKNSL